MNVISHVLLIKIKNNPQLLYVCHYCRRYFLNLTNRNKFEDTKGVTRSRKFAKRMSNGQNYIYRILKIEQHEKTGAELWCPGRVDSSCSTNYTSRVTYVKYLVTSHERGKKVGIVAATNEAYPWTSVT